MFTIPVTRLSDVIKILNLQFLLSEDFSFHITSTSVTPLMKGVCYVSRYRVSKFKILKLRLQEQILLRF